MNNNPIGWPDSAFGYNSSTQTLTAPTVAATKALTATVPANFAGGDIISAAVSGVGTVIKSGRVGSNAYVGAYGVNGTHNGFYSNASSGVVYIFAELGAGSDPSTKAAAAFSLVGSGLFYVGSGGAIGWASGGVTSTTPDTFLRRDAANTLAQYNGTNAQTYRVYNTFTSSTNYERGKLEWTSNTFRVGTEKGSGGGTARSMALQTDATDRLTIDTIGSVRVATALTVATLPGTPTVGMIARVTDASAPAVGSIVTGGGAAAALCWYNGTNWTVLGI